MIGRVVWFLRVRLPARWRLFRGCADELNRRSIVEQYLFDCAKGKRPLPDADRCRRMALKLGVPGNDIRIDPPEPEDYPHPKERNSTHQGRQVKEALGDT